MILSGTRTYAQNARIVLNKGVNRMAFFQELGKQLSDAAQSVGKKTSETAEVSRLNGKKQGVKQQIDALYEQVGKAFFATRDAQTHEEAVRLCAQIVELTSQLERLDQMIDKVRGLNRCPNCGGVQPVSARFCASCGARLPEREPEPKAAPPEPDEEQTPDKGASSVEINWPEPGKGFFSDLEADLRGGGSAQSADIPDDSDAAEADPEAEPEAEPEAGPEDQVEQKRD